MRTNATAVIATIAFLATPVVLLAQDAGGAAGERAAGSTVGSPPTPGTNSAGTAQSSGSGVNTAPGVTTGAAGAAGTGTMATSPTSSDAAINQENKAIDRKLKGICRGC
jgi:hypothetical protein